MFEYHGTPEKQDIKKKQKKQNIIGGIIISVFFLSLAALFLFCYLSPHKHNSTPEKFFWLYDNAATDYDCPEDKATVIIYNYTDRSKMDYDYLDFTFKAEGPENAVVTVSPDITFDLKYAKHEIQHLTPGKYHLSIYAENVKQCCEYELKAGMIYVIIQAIAKPKS